MKNGNKMKRLLSFLVLLVCITLVSSAFAGTSTSRKNTNVNGDSDLLAELNSLPPFKFMHHNKGIGYGTCPVYTAPSKDAFRCADGRAACDTNSKMDDAGYDASGWLMVRYETNNGGCRVGYIPPKYIKDFQSSMYPHFGYIPATAEDVIYVTDNPLSHYGAFAELEAGETFYILSKYNYYKDKGFEWWYIECTVDGQVARGFIDMYDSSFTLGSSDG